MRWTFVDRGLFACLFVCVLLFMAQEDVFCACDAKCRMILIYYEDLNPGINCFNWQSKDCQVCNTGQPTCRDVNGPGAGKCTFQDGTKQQFSPATLCTLKCNLPVGLWAEAIGTSGNNWQAAGPIFTCNDS